MKIDLKCFLGGLAYVSNEDSLRQYFSRFGEVRTSEMASALPRAACKHTISLSPMQLNSSVAG